MLQNLQPTGLIESMTTERATDSQAMLDALFDQINQMKAAANFDAQGLSQTSRQIDRLLKRAKRLKQKIKLDRIKYQASKSK